MKIILTRVLFATFKFLPWTEKYWAEITVPKNINPKITYPSFSESKNTDLKKTPKNTDLKITDSKNTDPKNNDLKITDLKNTDP